MCGTTERAKLIAAYNARVRRMNIRYRRTGLYRPIVCSGGEVGRAQHGVDRSLYSLTRTDSQSGLLPVGSSCLQARGLWSKSRPGPFPGDFLARHNRRER